MKITPSLRTRGDSHLLRIVSYNLLDSALEFTGGRARAATIEGGTATVKRVVTRPGDRVWAHGEVGKGAIFSFTLGGSEGPDRREARAAAGGRERDEGES